MEPLFVNISVRDEAMMKEYLRKTLLLRPFVIFVYAVAAYQLLDSLYYWIFYDFFSPAPLFIGIFLPLIYYLIYRRAVKLTLSRDLEANGGEPVTIEVSVTDSGLICRTRAGVSEIAFSSVKKVTQTKSLIIVITKARQAVILTRDGFTKGTAPELLEFLRSKGLKVKGK